MNIQNMLGAGILSSLAQKLLGSQAGATLGLGILGPQALHAAKQQLQNPLQTGLLGPVLGKQLPDPLQDDNKGYKPLA